MIWKLLNKSLLLVDLEGAQGVEVATAPDFGVLGEDCMAMAVISCGFSRTKMRGKTRVWNKIGGGAFRLKSMLLAPIFWESNF